MTEPTRSDQLKTRLANEQHTWLITGVAGFIGSNLLEALLKLNQRVTRLDNFATGYLHRQGANRDFRAGDVRHPLADIGKASTHLGYQPTHRICEGLRLSMEWYVQRLRQRLNLFKTKIAGLHPVQ